MAARSTLRNAPSDEQVSLADRRVDHAAAAVLRALRNGRHSTPFQGLGSREDGE